MNILNEKEKQLDEIEVILHEIEQDIGVFIKLNDTIHRGFSIGEEDLQEKTIAEAKSKAKQLIENCSHVYFPEIKKYI